MFVPKIASGLFPRFLSGFILVAGLATACGGSGTASAPASPGAKVSLTASYSEVIPDEWAPWMALDGGFFDKNGLTVDLQSIASANGVAALLSGQVQIAQLGGSEVVSAAAGGADVVIVANLVPVFPYVFMAPASVTSMQDLKGKKIGVSKIGGSADVATRAALSSAGLDPNKDVTIVETGSAANRVAALRSGAIQGGVSQPPESTTLQKQGFHVILDMAKQKLPAANTVVATTGSYLKSHKQVVQSYVNSLVEAIAKIKKDKATALQVLTKWEKVTDQTVLDDTYSFYVNEVFTSYPAPSPAQYQATVDNLKAKNPKLASFDVSKVLDASFVKTAQSKKLGG